MAATASTSPSARWRDLRPRVISAAILAPVGLGAIIAGGHLFAGLTVGLAVLMAGEWATMSRMFAWRWPGLCLPVATAPCVAAAAFAGNRLGGLIALAFLAAGVALVCAVRGRKGGFATLGVVYIGAGAASLGWVRADPAAGLANMLFLVLLVWASDIGAFMAGRAIGGPRLAPAISPGKTWSGAAGGLLAAMATGALTSAITGALAGALAGGALGHAAGPAHAAVVAGVLGIAAQAGDLLESAAKRHCGVKDSGRLIPGHGGLLDRLDAMLAAGAVAVLFALALGRGVTLWR